MAERQQKQELAGMNEESRKKQQERKLSETWAEDALGELEEWIEEQGVTIRQ